MMKTKITHLRKALKWTLSALMLLFWLHGSAQTYWIPDVVSSGPVIDSPTQPAGYSYANQDCIASVIAADPYCINTNYDTICENAYLACCPGCTDPIACNYVQGACSDDGSCTYLDNPVTDMTVYDWNFSYDWDCNGEDGSGVVTFLPDQTWIFTGLGVLGSWSLCDVIYMHDYDAAPAVYTGTWNGTGFTGTMDTGTSTGCFSLMPIIPGCMNPLACNYSSIANTDDGSCTYPGCTDFNACNYDFNAGCDSGSCEYTNNICTGNCINASNEGVDFTWPMSPGQWIDDLGGGNGIINKQLGSMTIQGADGVGGGILTQTTMTAPVSGTYSFDWNYYTEDNATTDPGYYINGVRIDLTDPLIFGPASQNGTVSFFANAGDQIGFGVDNTDGCCGIGWLQITNFAFPLDLTNCGCTDPWACNYDSTALIYDGSCTYDFGCTDPNACNYNFSAVCDNGSCVYETDECTAYCANPSGSGVDFINNYWPFLWTQEFGTGDGTITHTNSAIHITGNDAGGSNVLTQTSTTAVVSGDYSFDWCYFTTDGPVFDIAYYVNGVRTDLTDTGLGNVQNGSVTITVNAGDVIGFGVESTDGCCGQGHLTIVNFTWPISTDNCGCTNPWACNYDSTALNDDGSCTLPGCTDPAAFNYDPTATCDSGTCSYTFDDCSFEISDGNGNGQDFTGYYWPGNWTIDLGTGDGYVIHNTGSILIEGNNNNDDDVLTQTSISALYSGDYSFDWCYYTSDGPSYDIAYYINGVEIDLTDVLGGTLQNGSVTFTANAGDIIGFGVNSTDGCCGDAQLGITNFVFADAQCGCLNPWACNYDASYDIPDVDACTYDFGCTDPAATNYDSNATCENFTCVYAESTCTDDFMWFEGSTVGIGFNAYYAPANWTQSFGTGDGSIDHGLSSLNIIGNNNNDDNVLTEASIIAELDGVYSFEWCYYTTDGPIFDIAYYVNGVRTDLTDTGLGDVQNGFESIFVNAGDVLAFGIESTDGCCGEGVLTITQFQYPADPCLGCTNPWACNYDPTASTDDGSCDMNVGCTDPAATNWDPTATCDSGTCTYTLDDCSFVPDNGIGSGQDFTGYYWPWDWTQDVGTGDGSISHSEGSIHIVGNNNLDNNVLTQTTTIVDYSGTFTFDWCYYTTDGPNFDIAYYINGVRTDLTSTLGGQVQNGTVSFFANAGDQIGFGVESTDGCCGTGQLTITNFTYPLPICGCMNPWACNYDSNANIPDLQACTYEFGCTDPAASNYDSNAICDNSSCVYAESTCTDDHLWFQGSTVGHGFNAYYDPGNWTYNYGTGDGTIDHNMSTLNIIGNNNLDDNVLTEASILAELSGVYSFNWCYYTTDGPVYDIAYYVNGVRTDLTDTGLGDIQNGFVSIFVNAGDVLAFGIESTDGCCGEGVLTITNFQYPADPCLGCTNPWACNYDPTAFSDDGSCDMNIGCMDSTATNWDPSATCDSGTCTYDFDTCSGVPSDGNGGGQDFTGFYPSFVWTQDLGLGDGSITHNTGSIHIIGSDNGAFDVLTQTTTTVIYGGTFSFDWCYWTDDFPSTDVAFYINGVQTTLIDIFGADTQNGSVTFTANAGDIIGFGIDSTDGCCGTGQLTITNFTYPDYECTCLDPWACNYDSSGTNFNHDSDLCTYDIGCTDPAACNYDPAATCDNGSCVYNSNACSADCVDGSGFGVGFNEAYDPSNWTYDSGTGNGTITHIPGALNIVGNNNSGSPDFDILTEATIVADQDGTYSFDWCYFTTDGPNYDIAYYINGVQIDLTDEFGLNVQNGTVSFVASAGDVIGFGVNSTDGCCGEGVLTITNFTYPVVSCGCCPGDGDFNGVVNVLDLIAVSSNFGCSSGCSLGDANCDGLVNVLDLIAVSSNFGSSCP